MCCSSTVEKMQISQQHILTCRYVCTVCSSTVDPWASTSLNYSAFWTRYKFIGLINRAFLWSTWNTEDNLERPFVMKSLHARLVRKGRQLKLLIALWNSEKLTECDIFSLSLFGNIPWLEFGNFEKTMVRSYFFIARLFQVTQPKSVTFIFSCVFVQQIKRSSFLLFFLIIVEYRSRRQWRLLKINPITEKNKNTNKW